MRPADLLLMIVAFAGIAAGVLLPGPSSHMTPYALYGMIAVLFMSFMRIDYADLLRLRGREAWELALWSALKLAVLPVAAWLLARWLAPPAWELPVVLLAGVSSGVTAPFFAQLVGGDVARTLKLVVLTSVIVPVSLPALVSLTAGAELAIPFSHMFRMLALVIFAPLALAVLIKKLWPAVGGAVARVQFPLTLVLFFLINAGVFAPYADFLRTNQHDLVVAAAVAYALAGLALSLAVGAGLAAGGVAQALEGAVGLCFVNNVLALVFSARFFAAEAPLLAAAYMLPYYTLLIPVRLLATRANRSRA